MEYYNSILAFHVISFIAWMSMLLYLPRLFIYHVENKDKKDFVDVVKVQEMKLYRFIGNPAFITTFLSGMALIILVPEHFKSGSWLHIKLTMVFFLIGYHYVTNYYRKQLAKDIYKKSSKFFRFYNEIPTVLMIIIVIMVIVKPI